MSTTKGLFVGEINDPTPVRWIDSGDDRGARRPSMPGSLAGNSHCTESHVV